MKRSLIAVRIAMGTAGIDGPFSQRLSFLQISLPLNDFGSQDQRVPRISLAGHPSLINRVDQLGSDLERLISTERGAADLVKIVNGE
ncbi:MAG: hypothetical protein ACT4NP_09010 [Pseudonocardiales bacterium]